MGHESLVCCKLIGKSWWDPENHLSKGRQEILEILCMKAIWRNPVFAFWDVWTTRCCGSSGEFECWDVAACWVWDDLSCQRAHRPSVLQVPIAAKMFSTLRLTLVCLGSAPSCQESFSLFNPWWLLIFSTRWIESPNPSLTLRFSWPRDFVVNVAFMKSCPPGYSEAGRGWRLIVL